MIKRKMLIIDPSGIIREGIGIMLHNHSCLYEMVEEVDLHLIRSYVKAESPGILIVNPSLLTDNSCEKLKLLRQEAISYSFKIVALVYAYFDENVLSLFDEVIYINDDENKIMAKLKKLAHSKDPALQEDSISLSQRELDVVRLVALGYSNRDIAEELFISIHTVISHRKNITAKLGIKSASGLTIYAVINKLISPDDFDKTV